jgi:SAM-dependent methyltransferase
MVDSSQFYSLTYSHFAHPVLAEIRQETFGEDIGQNGWLTAEEYRHYLSYLEVSAASQVLDIGSGSGGPALLLARTVGCQVTGLDINPSSTTAANAWAHALGLDALVHFQHADASQRLPFEDHSFCLIYPGSTEDSKKPGFSRITWRVSLKIRFRRGMIFCKHNMAQT